MQRHDMASEWKRGQAAPDTPSRQLPCTFSCLRQSHVDEAVAKHPDIDEEEHGQKLEILTQRQPLPCAKQRA